MNGDAPGFFVLEIRGEINSPRSGVPTGTEGEAWEVVVRGSRERTLAVRASAVPGVA